MPTPQPRPPRPPPPRGGGDVRVGGPPARAPGAARGPRGGKEQATAARRTESARPLCMKKPPVGRFFLFNPGLFYDFDQVADFAIKRNAHFQKKCAVVTDDFVFVVIIYNLITDPCAFAQLITCHAALCQHFFQA